MNLVQLTDRVWILPHNEQTDRPVLGYIRGDRASLMIDAGNSPDHAAQFLRQCQARGLSAPQYVGLTHWHWDHCFGLCGVQATSIACARTNRQLKAMQHWQWTEQAMQKRLETGEEIPFCDEYIRREYQDPQTIAVATADIVFEDCLTLDLGGVSCQMLRVGGPHSEDSVVFYIPQQKVLFLGDADCDACYHPQPQQGHQQQLGALAQRLLQLDFDIGVPGHDVQQTRRKLIRYWESELGERLVQPDLAGVQCLV